MTIRQDWVNGKSNDDQVLAETSKLKGSKKGRNLFIITGHYAVQHCDYLAMAARPNMDTMILNFGYLLPGSEKFTWMFHGSMGYTKSFNACVTFKYFQREFKGNHVFMCTTRHCAGGLYPIAPKKSVITTLKNNKIDNFYIATHAYAKKGLAYVPEAMNHYSPAHIPYGCGGSFNAMALPFALQLGYDNIYVLGIGSKFSTHFYDVDWVQGRQCVLNSPHKSLTLTRYGRLNALAKKSGTKIVVMPRKYIEPEIAKIFPTIEKL